MMWVVEIRARGERDPVPVSVYAANARDARELAVKQAYLMFPAGTGFRARNARPVKP